MIFDSGSVKLCCASGSDTFGDSVVILATATATGFGSGLVFSTGPSLVLQRFLGFADLDQPGFAAT